MATQMTTAFTINNGTIDLAFSSLCEKAPSSNAYDAGKYCTTLCIKKGSKDEADFISGYNATAAEAMAKFGLQIPPVQSLLKDGDAYNAIAGVEKKAFGPNSMPIKDGNCDTYFIPNIDGSKVNISIKFNVGTGFDPKTKQAYSYARPYLDWIQQITPGASHSVGFSAPTAWTGAVPQVQPQMAPVATPSQPILNDTDFAGSAADLTLPFEF